MSIANLEIIIVLEFIVKFDAGKNLYHYMQNLKLIKPQPWIMAKVTTIILTFSLTFFFLYTIITKFLYGRELCEWRILGSKANLPIPT